MFNRILDDIYHDMPSVRQLLIAEKWKYILVKLKLFIEVGGVYFRIWHLECFAAEDCKCNPHLLISWAWHVELFTNRKRFSPTLRSSVSVVSQCKRVSGRGI